MNESSSEQKISIEELLALIPRLQMFQPRELYSMPVMRTENLTLLEVLALQALACSWKQAAEAECDYWTDVLLQMQPPN